MHFCLFLFIQTFKKHTDYMVGESNSSNWFRTTYSGQEYQILLTTLDNKLIRFCQHLRNLLHRHLSKLIYQVLT